MLKITMEAAAELETAAKRAAKVKKVIRFSVIPSCCSEKVLLEITKMRKEDRVIYDRGFRIYAGPHSVPDNADVEIGLDSSGFTIASGYDAIPRVCKR